jgi:hypothetical protein
MSEKLRVSFNSPQSGYMSVGLKAGTERVVFGASHQPVDSLRDLLEKLVALLTGKESSVVVRWNCEPDEYDFRFAYQGDGDTLRLEIVHRQNFGRSRSASQKVFVFEGAKLDLGMTFWQALENLRQDIFTDEYDKNWRRPFPQLEMQRFTEVVHALAPV